MTPLRGALRSPTCQPSALIGIRQLRCSSLHLIYRLPLTDAPDKTHGRALAPFAELALRPLARFRSLGGLVAGVLAPYARSLPPPLFVGYRLPMPIGFPRRPLTVVLRVPALDDPGTVYVFPHCRAVNMFVRGGTARFAHAQGLLAGGAPPPACVRFCARMGAPLWGAPSPLRGLRRCYARCCVR